MYFVESKQIEDTLSYMENLLKIYEKENISSDFDRLGLERLAHMVIESIIDVGNMMIDGFIMRDPGSYEDVIDILVDEKVVPESSSEAYKSVIRLRVELVKNYQSIDHSTIENVMNEHLQTLKQFRQDVLKYLQNEAGTITTFTKREDES
ncbi:DUF86 domain-containing protein [Halalkalibacillus sediminis]|uniref:DUF86 domain-containing protein n=1 Tax=Halalkalibacillus sediminis TaxID=2018042 RepID=A0A2I0QUS6_9BACI|nr:DUF86 domain-containing protein [Halalkalibacillus sediminis]PKR78101.1 DUF86 domain-containing protein [Halalkalibacillus sediminis]